MSISRRLTLLSSALVLGSALQAADLDQQDIETLRDWINSRRMVTVNELGGQLSISGDIHSEFQHSFERVGNKHIRGGGRSQPGYTPDHSFDIEFNLSIDYRADNTWAAAKLRFDNDAGTTTEYIGSGKDDKIKLDRAYFGYRIYDKDQHTMDVEVGRRPLSSAFDSKIQFKTNFDGILLKDSYAYDKVGDFYYQLGIFLINERSPQAGYAGEVGLQNIAGTGFYTKYSMIDWDTKHYKDNPLQYHFIISQLLWGYKFIAPKINKITNIYLAGLCNWNAPRASITNHERQNWGGYFGFSVGQIKVKGDWAFEANYQIVQAQSLPSFDSQGIGLGNTSKRSFYYDINKDKKVVLNTNKTAEGNVNFQGYQVTFQYLLTNNLNIFQRWEQSIRLDKHIGPFRQYNQYELDLIYLF